MDKMLGVFGFNLAAPLALEMHPGKIKEKDKLRNEEKTIVSIDALISKIEKGERAKPSLNSLVPFHVFKLVSQLGKKVMKADYEYYKDKGDYYYDTKINPIKTMLAKRIARKLILK